MIGRVAPSPRAKATAIPFWGIFNPIKAIRCAYAFFCSIGFAQARLGLTLRDWLRRTAPHAKAAAIPFGGGFTQNEAIRCAHFFFCLTGFAQARLARLFKQKNPAIAGLHFGWRSVRDYSRTP